MFQINGEIQKSLNSIRYPSCIRVFQNSNLANLPDLNTQTHIRIVLQQGKSTSKDTMDRRRHSRSPSRGHAKESRRHSKSPSRGHTKETRRHSRSPSRGHAKDSRRHSRSPSRGHVKESRRHSRSPSRGHTKETRRHSKSPSRGHTKETRSHSRSPILGHSKSASKRPLPTFLSCGHSQEKQSFKLEDNGDADDPTADSGPLSRILEEENSLIPPVSSDFKSPLDSDFSDDFEPTIKSTKKEESNYDDFKSNLLRKKMKLEKGPETLPKGQKAKQEDDDDIVYINTEISPSPLPKRPVTRSTAASSKLTLKGKKSTFKRKDELEQELKAKEEEIANLKRALSESPSKTTRQFTADNPYSIGKPDVFGAPAIDGPSSSSPGPFRFPHNSSPGKPFDKDLAMSKLLDEIPDLDVDMASSILAEVLEIKEPVTWDSIAGLDDVKRTLQDIVVNPLIRPDIFTGLKKPEKGVLLFGPPGTGKTLIGKCLASLGGATFFAISAASVTSKWVGTGEKRVRLLFKIARVLRPSIIYIDEVDSILSSRESSKENECLSRLKTEILASQDGLSCSDNDGVLLIGATNLPQKLDSAARRRFTSRLMIPLPDAEARRALMAHDIKNDNHSIDEDGMSMIVKKTEGYSGADLHTVLKDAAKAPIRELTSLQLRTIPLNKIRPFTVDDVLEVLKKRKPSVAAKDMTEVYAFQKMYGTALKKAT
ncbi:fidgetin-like protein 1 isoform X2 [Thrips palmi]|uniref:Fidgetin-like protein 1 isoform X2 n=2 Tax=Thrips palmi TaxID=161013 RepID=A0A6P9A511_THRPL|nr:fidgetin-like protein 1 isoform X2 [Thrips palmi]